MLHKKEKALTSEEALRLFKLLSAASRLVGSSINLIEKGYDGIYPTRRDLMVDCNKVRDAIEELEKAGDIIVRRKK